MDLKSKDDKIQDLKNELHTLSCQSRNPRTQSLPDAQYQIDKLTETAKNLHSVIQ